VEQHVLRPGDVVPLPHYADGTEAQEGEVFWTAHVWQAKFLSLRGSTCLRPAAPNAPGDLITVDFSGRVYSGGSAIFDPYSLPVQTAYEVDAVVTVVAARAAPTPAARPTFGQLKAQYRK